MKKKLKFITGLAVIFSVCMLFVACKPKTVPDEYAKKGYDIFVTYDSNGGNYMGRKGVSLTDAFKSSSYEEDADGKVRIKLIEPTDRSRIKGTLTTVSLSLADHFFAGWYKNRVLKTVTVDGEEKVTDEYGVVLEKKGDKYYYPQKEGETTAAEAIPGYNYSDRWDFETDAIEFVKGQGKFSMTLYAGWVPYYEFAFYAKNDNGNFEKIGSTFFDYKMATSENGVADYADIWIPTYVDGAMNYSHEYSDKSGNFEFPKKKGYTFSKAYSDEAMSREITDTFRHTGGIDLATATPVNRVNNIYVEYTEGEIYKISTAKQFIKNFNIAGIFEIYEDLDFSGETWPNYTTQTFSGKIVGMDGVKKFSSVTAAFTSSASRYGGLFGRIGKDASIKNIDFENVTITFSNGGKRLSDAHLGLFAGEIEEKTTALTGGGEKTYKAEIENVSVSGEMRLGELSLSGDYSVNTVAAGNTDGITVGNVKVVVFGAALTKGYVYRIDPESVRKESDGSLSMEFVVALTKDEAEYEINIA